MKRTALLTATVVACALTACTVEPDRPGPEPQAVVSDAPSPAGPELSAEPTSTNPAGESRPRERGGPVPPDLRHLASAFVKYGRGEADSFPHWESVTMSLGGQTVKAVDDIVAALGNRGIWKLCPADWQSYGAAACPVDILGPIKNSALRDADIVYASRLGAVICAHPPSGPLPRGRLVVLRPTREYRTCATDFALALVADDQGLLRHVDLTLSDP